MKKIITNVRNGVNKFKMWFWLLPTLCTLSPTKLFADFTNPWASAAPTDPNDVSKTVDTDTSSTLEAVLLICGVVLIVSCIVLIKAQLDKGADEKKAEGPGKSMMWMIVGVLGVVIGLVLIGLAWVGASALKNGQ